MKYNLKYRVILAVYACCMQLIDLAMCPAVMDGRGMKVRDILFIFFVVMIFFFALRSIRRQVELRPRFERILFAYDMILLVLYVSLLIGILI